jgi:uncharacterized protein (DUF305 family)
VRGFAIVAIVGLVIAAAAAFFVRSLDPAPAAGEAATALLAAHGTMMSGMQGKGVAYSGDPDLDFVTQMIPHHQGAIDMGKVELKYGSNAGARKLAEGIIKAQESEIALMTKWKQGRAPAATPDAAVIRAAFEESNKKMMADMAGEHAHATNADLSFLSMMIPHHQGAIDMADVELKYGKDPEIRALAERIIAAQKAEITEMNEMLAGSGHHH